MLHEITVKKKKKNEKKGKNEEETCLLSAKECNV
jgi:hypothetical protein